jgi:hypothetical protein
MPTTAVSLAYEVADVERAVDAARGLADHLRAAAQAGVTDIDADVAALAATLTMIGGRLRLVRAAIRRTVNPVLLQSAHNAASPERLPGDDPDLRRVEWSPRERAEHAEREAAAAAFLGCRDRPAGRRPRRSR